MKRIYLSGPMTGRPDLNFPAFHSAAARLRALGYDVVSPAEIVPGTKATWHDAMRTDIKDLLDCDTLALLDGWQESAGAHLEMHVAHRVGIKIVVEAEIVEACAKDSLHDYIREDTRARLKEVPDGFTFISGTGQAASAEPVAWAHFAKNGNIRIWTSAAKEAVRIAKENGIDLMPLYPAPQPDRVAELTAEVERFREHSQKLNAIGWRISEALGDVSPGANGAIVDIDTLADRVCAALAGAAPAPMTAAASDVLAEREDDLSMRVDQFRELAKANARQLGEALAEIKLLRAALSRLLTSDPTGAIANATDDELRFAVNDERADPVVREQAASILQGRAALAGKEAQS